MLNNNVNIEKHTKTYLLNTCVITEHAKLRKKLCWSQNVFAMPLSSNACLFWVQARIADPGKVSIARQRMVNTLPQ
jgi:hypothetical protein